MRVQPVLHVLLDGHRQAGRGQQLTYLPGMWCLRIDGGLLLLDGQPVDGAVGTTATADTREREEGPPIGGERTVVMAEGDDDLRIQRLRLRNGLPHGVDTHRHEDDVGGLHLHPVGDRHPTAGGGKARVGGGQADAVAT